MHDHKILNIPAADLALQELFRRELGISPIVAQVLINRGVKDPAAAERFLSSSLRDLLDPYAFADMHTAVGLIEKVRLQRQKVLIFGDYDVDGMTSLSLLKSTFAGMGIETDHYIPHRVKEGYGLSKNILQIARQKKAGLVVTVDCGTNSHAEIRQLRQHGIEVVVTDHHEQDGSDEKSASALINPKAAGSSYGYRDLAGVGVAFKLCQALRAGNDDEVFDGLDLVCLGTIADVVPLTGENRIFAREGLRRLSVTKKPGLKALMEVSKIKPERMNAGFVSYILAPRLNASGRMDTAETALRLLLSADAEEAHTLARQIDLCNRERQKVESRILDEAQSLIDREVNFKEHKVIVLAKEDWHQGVLGIVASKLADRFYRPTIIISLNEGLCKGSGRSIRNFHLFGALAECKELLKSFGGHSHAAGLVIPRGNISDFREKINRLAGERLRIEDLIPAIDIDMEVPFSALDDTAVRQFEQLEPFGCANPEPLFYTRNLTLKSEPQVLSRYTLKFWATDGNATYQVIGFGMAGFKEGLMTAGSFDLVYRPQIDSWNGRETLVLEASEIFIR